MDDTVERGRRVATGDKTGAGDETSGRHDGAEASAVDDRLVVDGTTPSSRGVDDYLEDRKFSVKSFEFYWLTCSPSSRPKTSPWVTSILPLARVLLRHLQNTNMTRLFFNQDKGSILFAKRTVKDAIQQQLVKAQVLDLNATR